MTPQPDCRADRDPRMAPEWYIDIGGSVEGPLTAAELHDRAASGRLQPTDSVSADRVTWVPAGTVAGLPFPPPKLRPLTDTVVSGSLHASAVLPDTGIVPVVSVPGYQILETLGTGACGVVYKARQEKLNRVVALKTVLVPEKASRDLIDRFKQEAVALARLQHPNIVAVHDSGVCDTPKDQMFFAMELLDGEDLAARLERGGPLDERTAWLVARQTAAALAHAAKHGVIHRDIKPANLFLVPPPTGFPLPPDVPMVKVTDFGLALTRGSETDQRQTAAGVMLGTPVYMAPEQFTGSKVDSRADIYSLGATVYHMLTGQSAFDGRTVWEVMMRKSAPPPRLELPVSTPTADLVAAMMAVERDDRPADYADLIARIDALPFLEGCAFSVTGMMGVSGRLPAAPLTLPEATEAAATAPSPAPARRRKTWLYAVAAVALLGVGVGIAALVGAFNRPTVKVPDAKPVTYVAGAYQDLYVSGSLVGWKPAGGNWAIEQDDEIEKTTVLAGTGVAVRTFDAPPNFRVTLCIDPHLANAVEVQVAATNDPPASATRWLVRLDRGTATASLGKRVGQGGAFEPVGTAVPLPTPQELVSASKRPYMEVKYERAGGTLVVWFLGQPLGSTPDAGLKTTEFRVQALGGAIRIDLAALEELIEQK